MKNIKLIDVSLCTIILLVNLYIGTPLKYNIDVVNIVINIVAIWYLIIDQIKNKKNFKLNKIDVCVIIIVFSTFIPLISDKYLRLRDTVYYIIKYISILNFYFIVKKCIQLDNSKMKIISNTIIIMSIILIIFGIDLLMSNIFNNLYEIFKISKVYDESIYNMSSLFKYSNTFAVFITFAYFITLGSYLNEVKNEKLKKIYGSCLFFQIFAVIASYTRIVLILQMLGSIIFIILAKKQRKEMFKIFIISVISAILSFIIFDKFRISGNIIELLILLVFITITNYVCLFKLEIKNKKNVLIFTFILLGIIMLLIIITPKKLILFEGFNPKDSFRKQNIKVEPNTEYSIKVDLNLFSEKDENVSIFIKQYDSYENNILQTETKLSNFNGIKDINITTLEETKNLAIIFKCFDTSKKTRLEINEVSINDEKINVYYGLIPVELINKFEKLKADSLSVKGRTTYITTCFNIAKENFLFGYGGNAWRFVETGINIENSIAEHSYLMQLFIQFGIVGVFTYIIFVILVIKKSWNIWKNNKENYLIIGIIFGICIIMGHSIIDFDMSFFNIILMYYACISILNSIEEGKSKQISYKLLIPYGIILLILLYINIGSLASYNINTQNIMNSNEKLKKINLQIALAPYDYSYRKDKINILETLKNSKVYDLETEEYKNLCKEIIKQEEFILNKEKFRTQHEYKSWLYNKIDLMTDKNKTETLTDIVSFINKNNVYDLEGVKIKLAQKIEERELEELLKQIKVEVVENKW